MVTTTELNLLNKKNTTSTSERSKSYSSVWLSQQQFKQEFDVKDQDNSLSQQFIEHATTQLKPHEITDNLEFLSQNSFKFNLTNSSAHSGSFLSSNSPKENLFNLTASTIHPPSKRPRSNVKHSNQFKSDTKRPCQIVSHDGEERHTRADLIVQPIKRFRSISSYDLNFPNLNFKKPKHNT